MCPKEQNATDSETSVEKSVAKPGSPYRPPRRFDYANDTPGHSEAETKENVDFPK